MSAELATIVRRLHHSALTNGQEVASDAELLRRFAKQRDESSFELLVWRHGQLVLNTCRRVLGQDAEVEDAFQATFLALVRHAGNIRRGEVLAGWLHRVARRIALRTRSSKHNRRRCEKMAAAPEAKTQRENHWAEVGPLLDEEIDRLPEKFRLPFVLFHLHGLSHEEAARQLGVPKGTLLSRLARAREKLLFRLSRRGVALGAGSVAVLAGVTVELPAAMVRNTLTTVSGHGPTTALAAVTLMEGMYRAMFLNKLRIATAIALTIVSLSTGSTLWACHGRRAQMQQVAALPTVPQTPPVEPPLPPYEEQAHAAPPAPIPVEDRLTQVLRKYEQWRNEADSVWCSISLTERDKDGTLREWKGELRYLAPNYFAMHLLREDNPKFYMMYIANDKVAYDYRPQQKTLYITECRGAQMPKLTELLAGIQSWKLLGGGLFTPVSVLKLQTSVGGKSRFDIRLTKDTASENPYVYLSVFPRSGEDQREFTQAQIVLNAVSYSPRRFWVAGTNGSEYTWDIEMKPRAKLQPIDFTAPRMPDGWQIKTTKLDGVYPPRSDKAPTSPSKK
jgi:RNA polymerase sigma factor (sigma-70 family)